MGTAVLPVTLYATVNLKDALNSTYVLLTARTGRFLFQSAHFATLTITGSGTSPSLTLGSNDTAYDNVVNADTGLITIFGSGGANFVVHPTIVSASGDEYMAYADLSTSGLKLKLILQAGATTHTALIAITGLVVT